MSTKTEVALDMLAEDMASELQVDQTVADRVVEWLIAENAIDYTAVTETYDPVI